MVHSNTTLAHHQVSSRSRSTRKKKSFHNQFQPTAQVVATVLNNIIQSESLSVSIPDRLFNGVRDKSLTKTSYKAIRAFCDKNKVVRINTQISSGFMKGKRFMINATMLLDQESITPFIHASHRTPPPAHVHHAAQVRSDDFSVIVRKFVDHKTPVLTLDGTLRNAQALYKAGHRNTLVCERDPNVALYQRLVGENVCRPIWTGQNLWKSRARHHGIETILLRKNELPPDVSHGDIEAVYLDYCGDISRIARAALATLPNLKIYGINQSKRNTKGKFPVLDGFEEIKRYDQQNVHCRFYARSEIANNARTLIN